jgi:hypothetical protein
MDWVLVTLAGVHRFHTREGCEATKEILGGTVVHDPAPEKPHSARASKKQNIFLPGDYRPKGKHADLAVKLGFDRAFAESCFLAMKAWADGKGERRADWDAVLSGWIQRKAEECRPTNNRDGRL